MNGVAKFMGVNIDLSISVQPQERALPPPAPLPLPLPPPPPQQQPAAALDLLPCPPPKNGFLWQSLFHRSSLEPSPRLGIDVNQVPSPQDDEDETSSLQLMTNNAAAAAKMSHSNNSKSSYPAAAKRERDVEDKCEITSSRASDEEEGTTRKKLRLSKEQSALLEESFREHSTLNPKQKNSLAKQLNLRPRQVEVWFQNRRARTKLKQTEVECELLKRCCDGLTEDNRRLQKELQELRALKVAPPCVITHDFYMPLPATTLTMCPSCERLATVDNTANANASTNTNTNNTNNNNNNSSNINHFRGFLSNTANAKLIKPFPHQQKFIRTELMN